VQDPTTSPSGDLIPTIRGSGAHPGRGWLSAYVLCVFCFPTAGARTRQNRDPFGPVLCKGGPGPVQQTEEHTLPLESSLPPSPLLPSYLSFGDEPFGSHCQYPFHCHKHQRNGPQGAGIGIRHRTQDQRAARFARGKGPSYYWLRYAQVFPRCPAVTPFRGCSCRNGCTPTWTGCHNSSRAIPSPKSSRRCCTTASISAPECSKSSTVMSRAGSNAEKSVMMMFDRPSLILRHLTFRISGRNPVAPTTGSSRSTIGMILSGCHVEHVLVGGPAMMEGIERGDEVLQIHGRDVNSENIHQLLIGDDVPGRKIPLSIRKRGTDRQENIAVERIPISSVLDRVQLFRLFTEQQSLIKILLRPGTEPGGAQASQVEKLGSITEQVLATWSKTVLCACLPCLCVRLSGRACLPLVLLRVGKADLQWAWVGVCGRERGGGGGGERERERERERLLRGVCVCARILDVRKYCRLWNRNPSRNKCIRGSCKCKKTA
jgi:hypothetical protein